MVSRWPPSEDDPTAGDSAGLVKVWNVETGKEELYLPKLRRRVQAVAFSPDGKTLALGDGDYRKGETVTLVERGSGDLITTLGDSKGDALWVYGLAFSADGRRLIQSSSVWVTDPGLGQGYRNSDLREWSLATRQSRVISSWKEGSFREAAISPDGSMIAVGAGGVLSRGERVRRDAGLRSIQR